MTYCCVGAGLGGAAPSRHCLASAIDATLPAALLILACFFHYLCIFPRYWVLGLTREFVGYFGLLLLDGHCTADDGPPVCGSLAVPVQIYTPASLFRFANTYDAIRVSFPSPAPLISSVASNRNMSPFLRRREPGHGQWAAPQGGGGGERDVPFDVRLIAVHIRSHGVASGQLNRAPARALMSTATRQRASEGCQTKSLRLSSPGRPEFLLRCQRKCPPGRKR